MKKLSTLFLVAALLIGCSLGANALDNERSIANEPPAPRLILNEPPELLAFDVNPEPPHMPWPTMYMCRTVHIDHPFTFEYTKETDGETGKPINWQPVDPVTLYQLPDGSWVSAVTDSSLNINELRQKPFYLVETDCYYRIITDYSARTQNAQPITYPMAAKYSINHIYSGILSAGRTGVISVQLEEHFPENVRLIHRCMLNIASMGDINIMPKEYASNINGNTIVTYYPTPEAERSEYFADTSLDVFFSDGSISVPFYNIMYD